MITEIHERVSRTGLGSKHTHRLCEPTSSFEGEAYSYQNPEFVVWEMQTKNAWCKVTCSKCLGLKVVQK